jgi:response regulator RpfG family c-di-GMP phosphodiesterase
MIQGLHWVMDPALRLSGVFLNPTDAGFSAFQFLEILLSHRPAVPVFLFEAHLSRNSEQAQKMMKRIHIKGVFSGAESYSTLIRGLQANLPEPSAPRRSEQNALKKAGFQAIPVSDLFTLTEYPHDLYVIDGKDTLQPFASKNTKIDPTQLAKAVENSEFIYIKSEDIQKRKEDVRTQKNNYLNLDMPTEWKTAETIAKTKALLHEMKTSGINDEMIEYTKGMLGDLFKLISNIDSDEGAISGMIEKARRTDRSVFCASYSLLIAKHLRFEKNATLEILGLASILQDLSLYRTPFGDLTDKKPTDLSREEQAYYLQHPTLSADLVANHTDIPQVTLQVVRQHHERKDKTGFPNHIGGAQLHPMAEILSLINSYYDVVMTGKNEAAVIQHLQTEVFQHYSENMIRAFKTVLGTIIQDKISGKSNS